MQDKLIKQTASAGIQDTAGTGSSDRVDFPDGWSREKQLFFLIDRSLLTLAGAPAQPTTPNYISRNDLETTRTTDFVAPLVDLLNEHSYSVRIVRISALCAGSLTTDGRYFREFFARHLTHRISLDNHKSALAFRLNCYSVWSKDQRGFFLKFFDLLSMLDSYCFDQAYNLLLRMLGERLPRALEVLLVPHQSSLLATTIAICNRGVILTGATPSDDQPGSLLAELSRRMLRLGRARSRERIIVGWFWLSISRDYGEHITTKLRRRILMTYGLLIDRRDPIPKEALKHIIVAPNVVPVYPKYRPGGTQCIGWGIPEGLRATGRSPYESSRYFELQNATLFDDWSLAWSDSTGPRAGHTGDVNLTRPLRGILDVRLSNRRWRESGVRGGLHALDVNVDRQNLLQGRYFLASSIHFMGNFGHFIYQSLPNISAYLNLLDDGRTIVVDGTEQPFHLPFLDFIGVHPDRVLFFGHNAIISGDIAFFEESYGPQVNFIRVRELRKRTPQIDPGLSPYGKRVYLSRRRVESRQTGNEEEIEAVLRRYGFETVIPDDHSPREQVAILENAEIIVSPHGSALTNLVFCRNSKIVIEGHSKTRPSQTTFMHMLSHKVYWSQMTKVMSKSGTFYDQWNIDEIHSLMSHLSA